MKSRKYTSVFIGSLIISLILVALGFVPGYETVSKNWRALIGTDFGWFYLLLVTLIVLVCGFFVLSPMGQIKLGEPDSKPEYSTGSWIAMLFSAGMGIGLVFYGAAEPLSHLLTNSACCTGVTASNGGFLPIYVLPLGYTRLGCVRYCGSGFGIFRFP